MLQVDKTPADIRSSTEFRDDVPAGMASPAESFSAAVAFVRREYPIIVFVAAIILVLGLVYLFSANPHYTAQASLIIDTRKVQLFQQAVVGDPGIELCGCRESSRNSKIRKYRSCCHKGSSPHRGSGIRSFERWANFFNYRFCQWII